MTGRRDAPTEDHTSHDRRRRAEPADLRVGLLGVAAWAGALLVLRAPGWLAAGAALAACFAGAVVVVRALRTRRQPWVVVGMLLSAAAVASGAGIRLEAVQSGPVARLADQRAVVSVAGRVDSDPVVRPGRYGDYVLLRLEVTQVTGRGRDYVTAAPVLVLGELGWERTRLGDRVSATGRLGPADDPGTAAVLTGGAPPRLEAPGGAVLGAAERVRAGIRQAVAGAPDGGRELVPALIVGDDRGMQPALVDDFRTTGLTHLTAVSGTNLTLVVGFLLLVARAAGVRARGLLVVGLLGVCGFVVVARAEPSVVRAAAMGTVALLGLGSGGRRAGVRALGVATFVLLLLDPWLAVSVGFALSVLATAGILFLAPVFRDAMTAWLPRWAAEAVAVPLAAQLVCTPVVAAVSDEVSLVAVAANMLVAPAVAPATVLGLLGGLLTLLLAPAGAVLGWLAGWCGWWVVAVATQLARLPQPAVDWRADTLTLTVLTLVCAGLVPLLARLLRRRGLAVTTAVLVVLATLRPLPDLGWPPAGWVMVACDVGQGDGLVFNAGRGRALVVDAGPDPAVMDRCLRRLQVEEVLGVVLTHFHADHVDGLPGVLRGRTVGEVLVSPVREPPEGAAAVDSWAAAAGVRVRVPELGEVHRAGRLTWQVVGPAAARPLPSEGSAANNASLVLLARAAGVRVLATGDVEPEGQAMVAATLPALRAGVVKVPHHGSANQDLDWLAGLRARVAVVSAGERNDYGHPSPRTLAALRRAGALVARTDTAGDLALLVDAEGALRVAAR